jgi:hypothetical protein
MILRSRKGRRGDAAAGPPLGQVAADEAATTEQLLGEIDALGRKNRGTRDPQVERRILTLRHLAGLRLTAASPPDPLEYPPPAFDRLSRDSELPEVAADEPTAELLRAAILRQGCLLVRGFVDPDEGRWLAEEIERAFAAREARLAGESPSDGYYEEFEFDPWSENLEVNRPWIAEAGGLWVADSPRIMFELLDLLEQRGLRRLAAEYLGERPTLSVHKSTLRKAEPTVPGAWHQDGRFMGDTRSLNMWLSLSRCGDEAPGLDLVPRRLDHIVPTGTEGAMHDNDVSPAMVERAAGEAGIIRPIFEPGDMLLFDDLFLHKTGSDPDMPRPRYAVESWFFAPSSFPGDYLPLAF